MIHIFLHSCVTWRKDQIYHLLYSISMVHDVLYKHQVVKWPKTSGKPTVPLSFFKNLTEKEVFWVRWYASGTFWPCCVPNAVVISVSLWKTLVGRSGQYAGQSVAVSGHQVGPHSSFFAVVGWASRGADLCSTRSPERVREIPTHHSTAWVSPNMSCPKNAEDMKFEAVVVTVALADEEEYLSALAKKVHITALQVKSSPPHSSRRGMCSQSQAVVSSACLNFLSSPPHVFSPVSHTPLR